MSYALSFETFLAMFLAFISGFFYSWKLIRLKSIPLLDFISHGFFLSGSIFLTSYLAMSPYNNTILPTLIVFSLYSFGSALFNQTRDFKVDRETNINNTASVLGYEFSVFLQNIFYFIAIALTFGIIYQNRELLNMTLMTITLGLLLPMILYIIFIKKSALPYYDTWLYAIAIPGIIASLLI
jgi:4-hydroxybenzoate polyprenyltransferase